jgi:hypothetical protein
MKSQSKGEFISLEGDRLSPVDEKRDRAQS